MNIPMIYVELEKKNKKTMSKVLTFGSFTAVIVYVIVGIFGYVTFVYDPDALMSQNIFEAPYQKNVAITIVLLQLFYLYRQTLESYLLS